MRNTCKIVLVFQYFVTFCSTATTAPSAGGFATSTAKPSKNSKGGGGVSANNMTYAEVLPNYNEYGYSATEKNGPQSWSQRYASCGGKRQSPVDLAETEEIVYGRLPNLQFDGMWDERTDGFVLQNIWNSVEVRYTGDPPKLRGGPLKTDHVLSTITFHWGNEIGSEHAFDRYFYSMEMHLIFFKKQYENIVNAAKSNDGIVIVAVFFKISQDPNGAMMQFINGLRSVSKGGTYVSLSDDAMNWMRPFLTQQSYYVYQGSLTTPPCSEIVTWIIMENPVSIGLKQVREFQKLKNGDGQPILENRRPIQLLNGRVVYFSNSLNIYPNYFALTLLYLIIFILNTA